MATQLQQALEAAKREVEDRQEHSEVSPGANIASVRSNVMNATNEIIEQASQPLEGTDALRGGESAVKSAAQSIIGRINKVYDETDDGIGKASTNRMHGLFEIFNSVSQTEMVDALDAKTQGIPRNLEDDRMNPQYIRLSETRRLWNVWTSGHPEYAKVLEDDAAGSWQARLKLATELLKKQRLERRAKLDLREALERVPSAITVDEHGEVVVDQQAFAKAKEVQQEIAAEREKKALEARADNQTPSATAKRTVARELKGYFDENGFWAELVDAGGKALADTEVETMFKARVSWLEDYAKAIGPAIIEFAKVQYAARKEYQKQRDHIAKRDELAAKADEGMRAAQQG